MTSPSLNKELVAQLQDALNDILNGWRYIRSSHGELYGVGWDRADEKAAKALEALAALSSTPSALPVEGAAWPGPCNQCGGNGGHRAGCTGHQPEPHPEDIEGNLAAGRRDAFERAFQRILACESIATAKAIAESALRIVGTPSKEGGAFEETEFWLHHRACMPPFVDAAASPGTVRSERLYRRVEPREGAAQVEADYRAMLDASPAIDANWEDPFGYSTESIAQAQGSQLSTPLASPSEGGGEQIAHIKQAIYTISGGDFDATDDEVRRIVAAVLSLIPSRGEAVDAARYRAIRCSFGVAEPETGVVVFYPKEIDALVDAEIAAIQSQGSASHE